MGFSSWISGKVVLTILTAIFLYFVGSSLGLVPQPAKDFVSWFAANTDALLIALCFVVGCYTVLKLKRKGNQGE